MEVDANELFQIIGQKDYVIFKLQAELVKLQDLNKKLTEKPVPPLKKK